MKQHTVKRRTIEYSPELDKHIAEFSEQTGMSPSTIIRLVIMAFFQQIPQNTLKRLAA